ncbi:MAG: DUF4258 domain-containing protein [Nodosilinea sp. WJT8-NPBG4]|jgi:hypothetical protein|nr:DUF4258 domain-containing protein [Nodosilinea sp. WJT8-NPBG4]
MKSFPEIQRQLEAGKFEFTRHAFKRTIERNISDREICETASNLEIIEDYPDDKYSPSCLVLGFTNAQRALHIQISRMESDVVRIVTIYEPDEISWINFRTRR